MIKKVYRTHNGKFVMMYSHYERFEDDDDDIPLFIGIVATIILLWWGLVHVVDIFFNKLVWWQEILTVIPLFLVVLPVLMANEMYGKNPLHWWPAVWGTKVDITNNNDLKVGTLDEF